ncbi:hypothetical protein G6F56_009048 [Rhizopus delemar]|nr:hypothetical protein G6F56_009048 [Rhizopus delemar]
MSSSQLSGFRFLPDSTAERPILKSLAYADDILVFLSSPSELPTLLSIISMYERASNARLNRDKTLAVSLSGEPQPDTQQALTSANMVKWHDKHSTDAAIYLGYPLTSSKNQLKRFFEDLIENCQLHALNLSQRNLSILGRGLVANSLILSRIWHAIRVLSPPQSFFSQVRSVIIKFLARKSFPPVRFSICQRPKKEGGIAVLDPAAQHATLQLRWLHPLLSPSVYPERSTNFALSILRYCIRELSQSIHHLLPLVFPERRPSSMRTLGCLPSLLKTFDKLGVQIDWNSFNHGMVEELPLTRVCSSLNTVTGSTHATNWSTLLVKDAFYFDRSCGSLRRRPILPSTRHRNKLLRFFDLVRSGRIQLTAFFQRFVDATVRPPEADSQLIIFQILAPVFDSLLLPELKDGTFLDVITNKWFRSLYLDPLDSLPDDYPHASTKLWSTFWQTPFPHHARSILWRIYHNKLSSKSRLHRIVPSYFTDSSCIFCGWDDEDDEHFLWSCPSKQSIWSSLASRFLINPNQLTYHHVSSLSAVDLELWSQLKFDGLTFVALLAS